MNWLKKLFGIKTDFEIMLEHMRTSDERKDELIRLQMGTIDRVIAARYDRPTLAQEPTQPTVTHAEEDYSDVLTDGDDDAFFERLEKL